MVNSFNRTADRNTLLQKRLQAQRLNELQQKQQQELANLQEQQQQALPIISSLKQDALSYLVRTGKANNSFRALSKKEQSEIQDLANEAERQGARSQALIQVVNLEEQLGQRLDTKTREALIKETMQTGKANLIITQFAENKGFQGPVPKGYSQEIFTATGQLKSMKEEVGRFQGPVQRFQEEQAFRETGKYQALPLVVSAVKSGTFQADKNRLVSDIKTAYKRNDIPEIVRKTLGTGTTLFFREGVRRTEEGLKKFGVGQDSVLFKQTKIPVSNLVGDLALGSLLVGISGTSATSVSAYRRGAYVYEIDSAGNVIAVRKASEVSAEASKNFADFKQGLRESAIFKKAGSRYFNEPDLRIKTAELIQKTYDNPKLFAQLKKLYKQSQRQDLFEDILAQETDIVKRTNLRSASAVKDKPSQLVGSGQITSTSRYAGTGQYERTEQVAGGIPSRQAFGSSLIARNRMLSSQGLVPTSLEQIRQQFRLQTLSLLRSLQQQGLSQSEVQKSLQQLRTQQREQVRQRSLQGQSSSLAQRTNQAQQSRLKQQQRFRQRTGQGNRIGLRPRFRIPLPFAKPISSMTNKRITTSVSGSIPKYDIFARKKGKLIRINAKPILTESGAKDFLAKSLDVTLRASGTIRRSNRSGFARIPTSITGYLTKNQQKFYTNKKTGFLVERSKYRLERRGRTLETREIKSYPKPFKNKHKGFKRL